MSKLNKKVHELRDKCYHEFQYFSATRHKCIHCGFEESNVYSEGNKSYDTSIEDAWELFEDLPLIAFLSKQGGGYFIELYIESLKDGPYWCCTAETAPEAICKAYIFVKDKEII